MLQLQVNITRLTWSLKRLKTEVAKLASFLCVYVYVYASFQHASFKKSNINNKTNSWKLCFYMAYQIQNSPKRAKQLMRIHLVISGHCPAFVSIMITSKLGTIQKSRPYRRFAQCLVHGTFGEVDSLTNLSLCKNDIF